ncbi:hypothetical protein [Rhodoferax sp.]|uniref:hypothetical protein n=1 Tax=Rhodoferax sp. TaxID=50421 RepID=UPI00275C98C5|nr:hypothetical protein [Rhodoferax sp.]
MHNDTATTAPPSPAQTPAQQADAALLATTAEARTENAKQITELTDGALEAHIAAHIRGMVAATVAHVAINASHSVQAATEHWQQWALGVAKGFERGESAVA